MIYEILLRPAYNKKMTSDHLIRIESNLPTRSFEQWLRDMSLLDGGNRSTIVRWSILQTEKPAHFKLASQLDALKAKIAELIGDPAHETPLTLMTLETAPQPSVASLLAAA